jgi:hypothetical protein
MLLTKTPSYQQTINHAHTSLKSCTSTFGISQSTTEILCCDLVLSADHKSHIVPTHPQIMAHVHVLINLCTLISLAFAVGGGVGYIHTQQCIYGERAQASVRVWAFEPLYMCHCECTVNEHCCQLLNTTHTTIIYIHRRTCSAQI